MSDAVSAEALVAHALPEGVVLFGRYRVGCKLAAGAAASVYAAEDLKLEGQVALKVFDPLRGADPVARARFAREFQVLYGLNHPGVARALRFEEDPRFDVLVMELVEGESLRARLQRARLDWAEAVALGRGLAAALEACHAAGVVHRDLKPENIILHPERGPVVLDFGVAWFSSALTLTRTGAILGSPRYLAPELFGRTDVDARADVFSLGAILYEAVAGRPVRQVESMAELAAREGPDAPPPLSALRADLPVGAWPVVERAIATRPEHRYATARELAEALAKGAPGPGPRLEPRLRCGSCDTPLVLDLPICPGCGASADWNLEPGPFAVQLLEVPDPSSAALWLRRRYPQQLGGQRWLRRRLRNPPVPLATGVSERSAESLVAQARDVGARAEVLRARRVVGPALRLPSASPSEILGASSLHFAAVVGVGAVGALLGAPSAALFALPAAVGVAGVGAAARYARRPLLSLEGQQASPQVRDGLKKVQDRLTSLGSTRARRLAAAAVARAAPALLDLELEPYAREEAWSALQVALTRVQDVDRLHGALVASPKAELRAALTRAERRADPDEVRRLEQALAALTEGAVAHDLAVRGALEACRDIGVALAGRPTSARD